MSLRKFLILMTVGTIVSWIGWLVVLFYLDPQTAGPIGLSLFYIALFFALLGTFALVGFFFRVWFTNEKIIFRHVNTAVRQSTLFAILIVASLMLMGNNLYTWWSATLLFVGLIALELFFISHNVRQRE